MNGKLFSIKVDSVFKNSIQYLINHFLGCSFCRTQSLGSPLFKFTKQKQCAAQNVSSNDDIRIKTRKEADKYFEAEMKQSKIKVTNLAWSYLVFIYLKLFAATFQTNVLLAYSFIEAGE